jgi:hypothetical protein
VQLGLADTLRDGVPRSSRKLAQATGTHPSSLRRLLRALAALGVLEQVAADRFALTPFGQPLRSEVPDSLRDFTKLFCCELHWRGWGNLLHSLRSGETVANQVFGMPIYDYLARNAGQAAVFHDGQAALTHLVAAAVIEACDFSHHAVVADVGGGNGALLAAVLAANPGLRGMLLDLPTGLAGAGPVLEKAGVVERCRVIAGDFFEAVPEGADVHLLKSITHNWDDAQALAILANCRRALPAEGGRILLVERVMPERVAALPEHVQATLADLNMLLLPGGRERTEGEFRSLLAGAGFRPTGIRTLPTSLPFKVIEGVPAQG